jgi:hypothetical protein
VKQNDSNRSLKSQKFFNYIKQYVAFFESRSYQFLFRDYSLGRIIYQFDDDNKLVSYNMYWNPCPFNKEFIDTLKENRIDIAEYIDSITDKERIEMDTEKILQLLGRIAEYVPLYRMGCNMDPEAADVAWEGMHG